MAAAVLIPLIPQVAGVLSKIGVSQLTQHTARMQDAASENQALDNLIPSFDADLKAIADAYNQGVDPNVCLDALYAVDTNAYNYLRKQVGKAGTAWGGPSTTTLGTAVNPSYSATCNKGCTAGCCVYLNNLRPAIFGRSGLGGAYAPFQTSPGVAAGLVGVIKAGGGVVHVIDIAAPPRQAYGNYTRTGYTLTLKKPPATAVTNASKVTLASSGKGTNFMIAPVAKGPVILPPTTATSGASVSNTPPGATVAGVEGVLTSNSSVAILTVVGGIILIVTALFGQNALRVK
jgi:hypothetical protein